MEAFRHTWPRCDWPAVAVLVAMLAIISAPSLERMTAALRQLQARTAIGGPGGDRRFCDPR